MHLKKIWGFLTLTYQHWSEDKVSRLAASMAYYTIFSLAPLLIVCLIVAGIIFGHSAAQGQLMHQLTGLLGKDSAQQVQTMIASTNKQSSSLLGTVINAIIIVLGASGLFIQLQDGLNTVWHVIPKPGRGILAIVKERFWSFLLVLSLGVFLLISFLLSAMISIISTYLDHWLFPAAAAIGIILNDLFSLAVLTALFAMLFKVLPDVKIRFKDVWISAFITALLFTIGKFLLTIYISNSHVSSAYGAASSLIAILVWVFYSAQILFIGAEITKIYAQKYGSHVEPADNALGVITKTVESE